MTLFRLQFPILWQRAAYQTIIHIFISYYIKQLEANSVAVKNCKLNAIYSSAVFSTPYKSSVQAFDSFLPKAHFLLKINEFRSKQKREKVSQFLFYEIKFYFIFHLEFFILPT